jgi:hypothetical protein
MTSFAEPIQQLGDRGRFGKTDPTVLPAVGAPEALGEGLRAAHRGLETAYAAIYAVLLSAVLGLMLAASPTLRLTGHFFVDSLLYALAPWVLLVGAYRAIRRWRIARFGAAYEHPERAPNDALMSLLGAVMGPLLLHWFVPRTWSATRDRMDIVLVLMGVICCAIPISTVRKMMGVR